MAALRIPKGKDDGAVTPPEALGLQSMMVPAQMAPEHVMTKWWLRRP